jgi:CTP:molybdopterin cytidylyltransferase MocA
VKPLLVILAAGASERLGQCKALVDLGGRTPLEHLASAGAACDGALVVSGADHEAIARSIPEGLVLVHNRDWRAGRTGSVAAAARHAPGRDLLLAPVDVPLVPSEVFTALVHAWAEAGSPERGWLAPALAMGGRTRYGHPVVLGHGLLLELPPSEAPLSVLRERARPLLSVPVTSPRILDDLDGREDLDRLRRLQAPGGPAHRAPD